MSFKKFEQFILDKMNETRLPSVSAAIVQGDEVVWSRGFGFRNLEHGLAATNRTLYSLASVTKSFTCMAIMQLAEAGKLTVDDPIDQYFDFDIRPGGEQVRIWHLMTHTSGIPSLAYVEALIDGMTGATENWTPISTSDDLLAFMADAGDWTLAKPGERYFYLNEGYVLLGRIIEQVSGVTFATYVHDNILQPLGMTRSFFSKQQVEGDPDASTPYINWTEGDWLPSVYPYGIFADGGLISNVTDLTRYLKMYLGRGTYDGVTLLSPDGIAEMETGRVHTPTLDSPFGEELYGYGLGVKTDFLDYKLIGHSGSVGTATSYLGYIPEKNVGIVVLSNGSGFEMTQFGRYGLALALGQDPDDLPDMRRLRLVAELEGTYAAYKGNLKWLVKRSGDFLIVESKDKYASNSTILVPGALEDDRRLFYRLSSGMRNEIEFRVAEGQVDLIHERYLLRKTGKLPSQ